MRTVVILLILTVPAIAGDKALILNDQEQAALEQVLDIATKAAGLQIAGATVYLSNKLKAAPMITNKEETKK